MKLSELQALLTAIEEAGIGESVSFELTIKLETGDERVIKVIHDINHTQPGAHLQVLPTLSPREMEVFRGIAAGIRPNEIALSLNLSVKTVSTYRARIMEKTGMRSNAEVAAYAVRNGMLPFEVNPAPDAAVPRSTIHPSTAQLTEERRR